MHFKNILTNVSYILEDNMAHTIISNSETLCNHCNNISTSASNLDAYDFSKYTLNTNTTPYQKLSKCLSDISAILQEISSDLKTDLLAVNSIAKNFEKKDKTIAKEVTR